MNRRDFHRVVVGALGAPIVDMTSAASEMKMRTTGQDNLLPLKHLQELFHGYLFDDLLPFMDRYVIDHEQGGFMCTVRPNGERISESKSVWYQGRGLWVYSFLYNNFGRNQAYLDVAIKTRQLLEKSRPVDANEMWPTELHRDGSAASSPDSQIYGDMFIAEGLAELSKASGEREAWDEAKRIVLNCVRKYDREDYCPKIGETYLGPGARPFPGARIEGVWMVIIRTTTQMLEMHHDDELEALNRRAVDTLLNYHWNPRFDLINELINHDLSRPENEYGQLVYAGHAIETLWMVLYEALRRGDENLFGRGAKLFQRHCEVARDRVYGGLLRNLKNVDQNDWTLDKTLFPHQEALTGALCLVEHTGDAWARDFYSELFEYTRTKFSMRSIGSPLWQVMGDRQVTLNPQMTRAENYHQPRFLMLNLLAVERMIKRSSLPARQ